MPATDGPKITRPTFIKCPLCKNETLKLHCSSSTCTWYHCKTAECDALISPGQRRAHRLDPKVDASAPASAPRRVRYKMSDTGWQEMLTG